MTPIQQYEMACQTIVNAFVEKYFGRLADVDYRCVADDVTGVWCINDYWFNVPDMIELMRYKYSKKKMFEWYDYDMEAVRKNDEPVVCIRDYKKLK